MDKIARVRLIAKVIRLISRKAYFGLLVNIFLTPPKKRNRSTLPDLPHVDITYRKVGKKYCFTFYQKMQSSKVVIFAHGWGGGFQNFKYLFPAALAQDYSIVGFDAPAHGNSPGTSTHIIAYRDVIKYCLQSVKHVDQIIVVGHSLGGAASILAIMESPDVRVDRVFALAAPTDLKSIINNFMTRMEVLDKDVEPLLAYTKKRTGLDLDQHNWRHRPLPSNLNQVKLIHGQMDDVITPEECLSLADCWSLDKEQDVLLLHDTGHYNILKNKTAIATIFSS